MGKYMVFLSYLIMLDNGSYIKLYDHIKINNVRTNIMRFPYPNLQIRLCHLGPHKNVPDI